MDQKVPITLLVNLTRTPNERIAEYRRRRRAFDESTFKREEVQAALEDGWALVRELKHGTRLRRPKSTDEILENQLWCILYELGYDELNVGRNFKIPVSKNGDVLVTKQIDVFAQDEETVIVAECKACSKPTKRSLQKDVGEFISLQKPIANAIKKHYLGLKHKIIWVFATRNIIWSEQDEQRAAQSNIKILRDKELRYLAEISKNLGKAAKYQFHGEFLAGQKIPALTNRKLPAIRIKLGGNYAYNFSVDPHEILKVSFVNHRDLRDPSGAPSYQRLIKPARLKRIAKFLENGGYFPNSIIVNFKNPVRFDQISSVDSSIKFGHLYLPNSYKSCWIIDGQHRLYACSVAELKSRPTLSVIAFDRLPVAEEANLFTTINREQRPVTKKLLDELEGELKWDSPVVKEQIAAIASRAIDMLRIQIGGPFHDRIATPGIDSSPVQSLTLPEMRRSILQAGLIGRVVGPKKIFMPGPFTSGSNEDTLHNLVEGLSGFFDLVRGANVDRWDMGRPGFLCTNFGVQGHIRLLGALIEYTCSKIKQDPQQMTGAEIIDAIRPTADPVLKYIMNAQDTEFERLFKVKLGSGGQKMYYYNLCMIVNAVRSDFEPLGLREFQDDSKRRTSERADSLVKRIQDLVHKHVIEVLKATYGDMYLDKGVPNSDVHQSATAKRLQTAPEERGPLEMYFDFIDLKKIVEHKKNWTLFRETLSIQLPGEQNGLHKYVAWFDRINELRRISAHPFGRNYSDDDLELLDFIDAEFDSKMPRNS